MKNTVAAICLLLVSNFTWGQYNDDVFFETFFGRQPSPKAEAMGRSNVSAGGDLGSVLYNPATLGKWTAGLRKHSKSFLSVRECHIFLCGRWLCR